MVANMLVVLYALVLMVVSILAYALGAILFIAAVGAVIYVATQVVLLPFRILARLDR